MPGNYDQLATTVISRYIPTLVDRRQTPLPQNLALLNRTPEVERTDGEIVASSTGQVFAADIIADDQEAVVRHADAFTLQPNKIPNLKHGSLLTQEMLNLLNRLQGGFVAPGEDNVFRNYVTRKIAALIAGINVRKEALLWQMMLDSASYDRLGIKFTGVSWGMPADLKFTANPLWANPTTATPLSDIQNLQSLVSSKYGKTYDRVTMSTSDFNALVATTQFKDRAVLYFPNVGAVAAANLPLTDRGLMTGTLGRILGMTVEINDFQYAEQATSGAVTYTRFKPEGKVVLSNSGDDDNELARDVANAVVTESLVGNVPGTTVIGGGFGGPRVGPIGYATPTPDLNPPNIRLWGVQRCIPERNDKAVSAVITAA